MAKESRARFRHEDVSSVPKGWKVRTVTHEGSGHRVRVAFPPGRRQKGSGRLVSILHPLSGHNPCANPCTLRSPNPAELMVLGANPPRRRMNPSAYRVIAASRWAGSNLEKDFDTKEGAKKFAKSISLTDYFRPHIQKVRANPTPEILVMGANPAEEKKTP